MSEKNTYHVLLENIVKSIATKPEEVSVTKSVDERGVLLEVKTAPEDVPLIVGKQGRVIKKIRELVRMIALRERAFVNIRLIGEGNSSSTDTSTSTNTDLGSDLNI